jgi:hypothetical protein
LKNGGFGASKQEVSKRVCALSEKEIRRHFQEDLELQSYYSYMLPAQAEGSFKDYQKNTFHRYLPNCFSRIKKGHYQFNIKVLYRA